MAVTSMDSNSVDDSATTTNQTVVLNTPNLITLTRFALSIVVFVLISYGFFDWSFWIFVIAASTDWVDGYIARRTDQVTQLGRILDPFCDKMIICGVYILIAIEATRMDNPHWSLITGWMAVVVVGRELLVTMLRGYIEQHGGDFSASKSGKLKMVFQCIAVGGCLLVLAMNGSTDSFAVSIGWITGIAVWLAIVSTIYSGIIYIFAATKVIQELTKHTDAT